jgi:hypothetical protein
VNTEQLRQSLKDKWLNYYAENRSWLTRLGVWVDCDGQRRPASGFILAALSILEPALPQILPLIVDLNHNPDRIVIALGLNINPYDELNKRSQMNGSSQISDRMMKILPAASLLPVEQTIGAVIKLDEACQGMYGDRE